jgi:hypothetical protein
MAKGLSVVNDPLPMNGLFLSTGKLPELVLNLLPFGGELLSPNLKLAEIDRYDLIGVEQSLVLALESLSAPEQL